MEKNKSDNLISESFLWGVNITINEKVFNNKDIFLENKENKQSIKYSDNYEDILNNIDLIKNSSDTFIQNIIDQNPKLKNIKEKKEDIEIEE